MNDDEFGMYILYGVISPVYLADDENHRRYMLLGHTNRDEQISILLSGDDELMNLPLISIEGMMEKIENNEVVYALPRNLRHWKGPKQDEPIV